MKRRMILEVVSFYRAVNTCTVVIRDADDPEHFCYGEMSGLMLSTMFFQELLSPGESWVGKTVEFTVGG